MTDVPQPSPTPPACTALPAGASLIVEPVSASAVCFSGEGFKPGEPLTLVLTSEFQQSELHQRRKRIEVFPTEPVAADGCFTITVGSIYPVRGAITNTWQVALIHARGAACQTVILPAEK